MSTALSLVLLDIRSAENVGSLFRTADAFGVEKIYLVGYTPGPLDRFNRLRKDVAKAALGAEGVVPWERVATLAALKRRFKKEGRSLVALEQDELSLSLRAYRHPAKMALVLGNEVTGVPKAVLKQCDAILEIPMKGIKESLNVAVAGGIALATLLGE